MVIRFLLSSIIIAVLVISSTGAAVFAQILPENHSDGAVLYSSAALLAGTLPETETRIMAENLSSNRPDRITEGVTEGGRFKILVPLQEGNNRIVLFSEHYWTEWQLRQKPSTGPEVRIYWFCASDEPASDSRLDAALVRRLRTGLILLQTACAERGNLFGTEGETFSIPNEETGKMIRLTGSRRAAEYRQMEESALFDSVYRDLYVSDPDFTGVRLVFLSFARQAPFRSVSPSTGSPSAGKRPLAASGTKNLALLGLGGIDLWPETFADVYPTLTNTAPCSGTDETAGSATIGGSAAATLGFTLHELGHAFGLPDRPGSSAPALDVMNRGFLYFDRIFLPADKDLPFLAR